MYCITLHFSVIINLYLDSDQEQGRVVRKTVNANPGLKVNWSDNFSCVKMFSLLLFCVVWDYASSEVKVGSISAASLNSGEERGLLSWTVAGNRA